MKDCDDIKSKHVVICITGFMQEDQDKSDFWSTLYGYYKHAEIYAVSWNACTPTNFLQAQNFNLNHGKKFQSKGDQKKIFTNFINVMHLASQQFVYAVNQAKLTGILLAMFLH